MAINFSSTLRDNMLDEIQTTGGATAALEILSGTKPATCATAETDTVLATITLPATFMATATGGQVSKSGTWEDASADADGTAGYFRIYNNQTTKDNTTCIMQGTVGTGSEDLVVDNTSFSTGQTFTITGFTITAGNA